MAALILFNFMFLIYSIIFIFLNIIFYADFISSNFFNRVDYFDENYNKEKINGYLNYCLNNYFLFTLNVIQILLTIGFVLCNFFYFYG